MSIRNQAVFQKSLIAVAVITLSACSTTPRLPDYDLSRIGEGIINAGKTTADLSRRTWDRTSYLLGFSDSSRAPADEPLADNVDVASVDEDTFLPQIENSNAALSNEEAAYPLDNLKASAYREVGDDEQVDRASGVIPIDATPSEDLIHEVATNENLWRIAKKITGDATNWHVLADVNNLAPDAAVFPGQQLIIPGNMIKAGYNDSEAFDAGATVQASNASNDALKLDETLTENLATEKAEEEPVELAAASSQRLPIPDGTELVKSATDAVQPEGTAFKLQPSETLWDIAKRTTGDALNWQAIAEHNNFSEKQAVVVFAGQTIYVPDDLVRADGTDVSDATASEGADSAAVVVAANAKVSEETPLQDALAEGASAVETVAAKADSVDQNAVETTSELITSTVQSEKTKPVELNAPSLLDETQPILIVDSAKLEGETQPMQIVDATKPETQAKPVQIADALKPETEVKPVQLADAAKPETDVKPITVVEPTYETNDTLKPAPASDETRLGSNNGISVPAEIMVSGTYYPKAVYNEADFSSSLLMRVSPGTKLQVSNAMGTWFEVETAKGTGYVHQRDIK